MSASSRATQPSGTYQLQSAARVDDVSKLACDALGVGVAPHVAAEGDPSHAGAQGVRNLAQQTVLVTLAITAEDDHRHGRALDDTLHRFGLAGVERLHVVGAHLGRLAAHARDVLGRVLVRLVKAARNDLSLKGHAPALAGEGI